MSNTMQSAPLNPQFTPATNLKFFGPPSSSGGQISIENPYSSERTPIFDVEVAKHKISITRILPSGENRPFATATFPSFSDAITATVGTQEIPMRTSASDGSRMFHALGREVKWRMKGSGTGYELVNKNNKEEKLAVYMTYGSSGKSEKTLEILVPMSDADVDVVLATGLATMIKENKEGKQVFKFLSKVF